MTTKEILNWPAWTIEVDHDYCRLMSPSGAQYIGAIEAGRPSRDLWLVVNGSARFLDLPFVPGWASEVPKSYRGKRGGKFLRIYNPSEEIVLQFNCDLPDDISMLNEQLNGKRMSDEEYERGIASNAAPRGRSREHRGGSEEHYRGVYGGEESFGVEQIYPEGCAFRRRELLRAA